MPAWLKCEVTKGMFSDELTVLVNTRSGERVSVFVPKDAAEQQPGRVKVRVTEIKGQSFALLPDEHHSIVDVHSSDLQPA